MFATADGKVKFGSRHGRRLVDVLPARGLTPDARWSAFSARARCSSPRRLLLTQTSIRSVVFMLAHDDDDGSLGVVLNRPSPVPVDEIVPGWGGLAASPSVLFIGGPVQPSAAICIGRTELPEAGRGGRLRALCSATSAPSTCTRTRSTSPSRLAEVRVFTGYAGWGPGPARRRDRLGLLARAHGREPDVLSGDPEGSGPGAAPPGRLAGRARPSTRPTCHRTDHAREALRWRRPFRRRGPGPRQRRQRRGRGGLVPAGGARRQGRPRRRRRRPGRERLSRGDDEPRVAALLRRPPPPPCRRRRPRRRQEAPRPQRRRPRRARPGRHHRAPPKR